MKWNRANRQAELLNVTLTGKDHRLHCLHRSTGLGKDGLVPSSLPKDIEKLFVSSHFLPAHTGFLVCEEGLTLM